MNGPSVLVVRLDSDGDVLLTGPAVRAVAASSGRVTMLCSPRAEAADRLLPRIDEVVTFEAPWIAADPDPVDPEAVSGLVSRMAALSLDSAVVFTSFHQSALPLALLLRLAGVAHIAAISDDYPGSLLDLRHQVPDELHEVLRNLSLVEALGYALPAGDDGRLRVERRPHERPSGLPVSRYVVVHPGASVPARAWSPARNAALVRRLAAEGWAVVVTGGRSELELCASVAGTGSGPVRCIPGEPEAGEVVNLAGTTTLAGMAEVLAGAAAVVVGNTGPAHLAAAVGTPVVSLFAPTVPALRWRPWQVPHVLLGHQEIGCAGCRARLCPLPGQPCLGVVEVDDVVRAVCELTLAAGARGRHGVA